MNIDSVLVLFVAVGAAIFVVAPLLQPHIGNMSGSTEDRELEELRLHKETLYTAIRDLDFDFQTDKVDDHDYRELRNHLETEAVELLRRIDEVDPLAKIDDEIEHQIIAARQKRHIADANPPPQGSCATCLAVLQGDEKFCPFCGHALTVV